MSDAGSTLARAVGAVVAIGTIALAWTGACGNNKTWQFQLPDAGTLPRGYYMMFALNNAGVPSVATWVQVQ